MAKSCVLLTYMWDYYHICDEILWVV